MKDAYYFPHDYNAKDDPKCERLLYEMGQEGYGIFWTLIEVLRAQPDYTYPMANLPIVGSLPTEKLLVERILLCLTPCGELFVGQGRTEIVADKHLEQFDLSQTPPEIVTPQGAGIRPILNGRFFIVLVPRNPFLENLYAFVQQCISLIRLVENCPSQRIGTQIQTQYFCHMKKDISIKLHKFHSIPSFFAIFAL